MSKIMSFGKEQTDSIGDTLEDVSSNEVAFARREHKVRTQFWDKLKRVAGQIPFVDDLVAAYFCSMDINTPLNVRATLLGALAYFILPIDIVPDFIEGFGFGDDAAVLAAAISLVATHILPKHRAAAAKVLGKELPEDDGTSPA